MDPSFVPDSIADFARHNAQALPDKPALYFEGQMMTYSELDRWSSQTAQGLLELGCKPDERIGVLAKNSHLYFEILMAGSKAGVVTCPVNWRLAVPEVGYILNDAQVRVLFIGPEFLDALAAIRAEAPLVEHVICIEPNDQETPDLVRWRSAFKAEDPAITTDIKSAAIQLYTSGTTGRPKGTILSHRALLENYRRKLRHPVEDWDIWDKDDVSLIAMPCFHVGGTAWGLMGLAHGATGVVTRDFDPVQVLDFIDQYRISKLFLVPAAMQFVLGLPKAREVDYAQLRYILYGASPIPLELLRECIDVFGCGFVQMYGMTETSGTIVVLPPEDHDVKGNERMRSAGKARRDVELAILDEAGNPLPPREVGEIATRSVMNMNGYWNLPEATSKTLSDDGWLRTGDAGYLDEDGYVYIHDRVKDMIISGGENIYPAEVENAIYGHPGISDVAVIGVPDEKWGEAVKACVVIAEGAAVTHQDVIDHARSKIAAYKCPKSVDFVDSLPRNPSGKILRRELRSKYWSDKERSVN
ncbi:MAG: fatty acid--CoA ligase [Pseudomonadota bacterium]